MTQANHTQQLLPSAQSAMDWVDGKPWSGLRLSRDLVGRAALIWVGLKLAGEKDEAAKKALAGALAIETAVVTLAALTRGARGQ